MSSRRRARTAQDLVVSLGIAAVVLAPVLLHRGYVLRGDMVFVPDQPWKPAWLGLDGRVPRFVPGDAFLALAGSVVPGDLVQKGVLVLVFVLGGCGIGRVVARHGGVARAAAITLFLWNPWVLERLGIGQWGVVVGYALLPWTLLAAERVREAGRSGWPSLVFWLGLSAVFSPASGLVSLAVAITALLARPRPRQLLAALTAGLVVNLTWLVPALLTSPALHPPSGQFTAFGPRAESGLGVVASLLSLGGAWKSSIVPGERGSTAIVALSLVLTGLACFGLWRTAHVERARVVGLGMVALAALGLALLTAVPGVASALDDLASSVPSVGIVRDSPRYLGPVALALAVGIATTVDWIWDRAVPGRGSLRAVALLVVVTPVLALPSFAWGLAGRWHPVDYPAEWYAVRDLVPPGRMVVLPWSGGYRGFAWNGRHASLDPAPRFFPGDVLIDDRLLVGRRVLDSEDPLLRAVGRALDSGDPTKQLRLLGVRSVLEENGASEGPSPVLRGQVVHDGADLTLIDLGQVSGIPPGRPSVSRRSIVVTTDLAVLVGVLVAAGLAVVRRRPGPPGTPCRVRPDSGMRGRA
jgi:hypothetical protein